MLTAIYEEARFWFSTLAFRRRKRSMFFGFRRSVFNRVFGDFLFGIPHEQVRRSCGIFYFVFGEFFPRDLCASSFFSFSCWGEIDGWKPRKTVLRSVFFYSAQLSGEPKNSAPKKKNSAPKSKKCPCGIPKMTFPKHSNVENEFWFSTSFSLPIGRRTLL